MRKYCLRLLAVMFLIYAGGIFSQLFATQNRELPVILQDKTVPGPEVKAPMDLGPGGCSCRRTPTPPPPPKPASYLSDGRPYYGTGTKSDPFRDYPDVGDPEGGITFGDIPAPKEPETREGTSVKADADKPEKSPKKPEVAKEPTTPAKPKELTAQEQLDKKWDFWQDQYKSWESDRVAPLDQCLKNMAEAQERINSLRRDYERQGRTPPTPDATKASYPPQTPQQQEALGTYNNYIKQLEITRTAERNAAQALRQTRESAIFLEVPERERVHRENTERQAKLERERLQRLRDNWQSCGFADKYGSLPNEQVLIPDPSHSSKDPRKPGRKVDRMEHAIKSGK